MGVLRTVCSGYITAGTTWSQWRGWSCWLRRPERPRLIRTRPSSSSLTANASSDGPDRIEVTPELWQFVSRKVRSSWAGSAVSASSDTVRAIPCAPHSVRNALTTSLLQHLRLKLSYFCWWRSLSSSSSGSKRVIMKASSVCVFITGILFPGKIKLWRP